MMTVRYGLSIMLFLVSLASTACSKHIDDSSSGNAKVNSKSITPSTKGNEGGNGGGTWVCREVDQSIRWIEVLDLYEAQHQFNLTIPNYKSPMKDIVDQ